jgi:hypothetical protein
VGLLIAQVVGHIPYLLLGFTWGLSKKHEGTDASQIVQGKLSETYTIVFATAGQDAFAMVAFLLRILRRMESHSSPTRRFPHFLCQAASYMLPMRPLSKYVYSMSAGSDVFDLAS